MKEKSYYILDTKPIIKNIIKILGGPKMKEITATLTGQVYMQIKFYKRLEL